MKKILYYKLIILLGLFSHSVLAQSHEIMKIGSTTPTRANVARQNLGSLTIKSETNPDSLYEIGLDKVLFMRELSTGITTHFSLKESSGKTYKTIDSKVLKSILKKDDVASLMKSVLPITEQEVSFDEENALSQTSNRFLENLFKIIVERSYKVTIWILHEPLESKTSLKDKAGSIYEWLSESAKVSKDVVEIKYNLSTTKFSSTNKTRLEFTFDNQKQHKLHYYTAESLPLNPVRPTSEPKISTPPQSTEKETKPVEKPSPPVPIDSTRSEKDDIGNRDTLPREKSSLRKELGKLFPKGKFKERFSGKNFSSFASLGASIGLAHGGYIEYQNSSISGNNNGVAPKIWGTARVGFSFSPFKEDENDGIGIGLSLMYHQLGFSNKVKIVKEYSPNFTDELSFSESYNIHYVGLPLLIRMPLNKSFFIEAGPIFNFFVLGSRIQNLERQASGSGAFGGGFRTSESSELNAAPLVNKTNNGIAVNLGWKATQRFWSNLLITQSGSVLNNTFYGNFSSLSAHLQFQYNFN